MDIKILVATHKQSWVPEDSVYMPIQVGAALHENFGYTRDDNGENISLKNPNYCELTGLYWAWKNLSCDYVGLCHYRRYFGHKVYTNNVDKKKLSIFTGQEYEHLLKDYDVIIPRNWNLYNETVREQYAKDHYKKDLDVVEKIIADKYPEYSESFKKLIDGTKFHCFNMFVMSKKNFDDYCMWLFDILFMLERRIDISGYSTYNARIFGFLSERLLNVWLIKQNLRSIEVSVVSMENVGIKKKIEGFLKDKLAQCQCRVKNKIQSFRSK